MRKNAIQCLNRSQPNEEYVRGKHSQTFCIEAPRKVLKRPLSSASPPEKHTAHDASRESHTTHDCNAH